MSLLLAAGLGALGTALGSAIGAGSQVSANKTNIKLMREQNRFNAEQAQIQRDWSERMVDEARQYNSPEAMVSRGLNPYLQGSGAMAASGPAEGSSPATAAAAPQVQSIVPDMSSVASAIASFAQARKISQDIELQRAYFPLQMAQTYGNINWRNAAIGQSRFWNKESGAISAALDQSKERQELENMRAAQRLTAAQETQILLSSDAQRVINRYMDEQQQADLFIKGQSLINMQAQGALTESQVKTELQKTIMTAAQAKGQEIDNRVASQVADSLIKASQAANEQQFRESTYDYKNVKNRKDWQYSKEKYDMEYSRKRSHWYNFDRSADNLTRISRGIGNLVGSFR